MKKRMQRDTHAIVSGPRDDVYKLEELIEKHNLDLLVLVSEMPEKRPCPACERPDLFPDAEDHKYECPGRNRI